MANRKVMDAVNIETGEKVFFNSHADATFLSDGRNMGSLVKDMTDVLDEVNVYAEDHVNVEEAAAYVTVSDFDKILTSINSILDKING